MRRKARKQITKEDIKCYYCRKTGHTTWNYKFRANDLLKGEIKDKRKHSMALTTKKFIVEEAS